MGAIFAPESGNFTNFSVGFCGLPNSGKWFYQLTTLFLSTHLSSTIAKHIRFLTGGIDAFSQEELQEVRETLITNVFEFLEILTKDMKSYPFKSKAGKDAQDLRKWLSRMKPFEFVLRYNSDLARAIEAFWEDDATREFLDSQSHGYVGNRPNERWMMDHLREFANPEWRVNIASNSILPFLIFLCRMQLRMLADTVDVLNILRSPQAQITFLWI